MSQETRFTFKPLKKQCDDDSTGNRTTNRIRNAENLPFTISSSRRFIDFDIPSIRINANENEGGGAGGSGTNFDFNESNHQLTLKDGEYLPEIVKDKFDFDSLAGIPLEEVDPEFKYEETFLVIGRDGKVHRLSAKKSSFIFNPFNRVRRNAIRIWNWQLPVLLRIFLIFLCFSFVLPNYANNAVSMVVWNSTRYIFGGLLFAEICVNILARGFLVSEFTYLQSPWDWLDVTTFIIIFLNLYWKNLFLHSLEGVVLFKFIPIVAGLKTGFQLTIQILKNLVPALIYSLLTLWILIIVGLHIKNHSAIQLQNGNTTNNSSLNCELDNQYQNESASNESLRNYKLLPPTMKLQTFLPPVNPSQWNSSGSNVLLNNSFNYECLQNTSHGPSPIINLFLQTTGMITFQSFGTASTKQIADPLLNHHFFYVTLTLIFGTFGVTLLTAASVGLAIFSFRPNFHHPYDQQISPNSDHKFFTCLPKLKFQLPSCDIGALVGVQRFLRHPLLELLITTVICLDVAFILMSHSLDPAEKGTSLWILKNGQDVCILIYGLEFFLKLCFVPSSYLKSWWPLLDFAVTVVCALNQIYPVPILIHFRVLKISSRWPTLQLLFYVFFKSLRSRLSLLCILLLGWICVRFATVNWIYGSNGNIPSNFLSLVISQSFLITDWSTEFKTCQSRGGIIYLCYVTWLLEVLFGIVFSSVIFVTVINSTCDMVSRPVDSCCENDNYINLQKAVTLIKSQFRSKCCSSFRENSASGTSGSGISSSINPVRVKQVPAHLHIPSSNGGPNSAHHGVNFPLPPPHMDIEQGDGNLVVVVAQQRKNSLASSLLGRIRNLKLSSCFSIGVIFTATIACILEFDLLQRTSPYYNPRFYIDLLFVCYFLLILLWKLVKNNFKALKSPPWLLDFLIISASGFTIYTSILSKVTIRELLGVKFITSLSYFRGFMLITRLEWLKVGLIAITSEVRVLWRYLAGLLVVWMCLLWLKNNQEALSNKWFNDGIDGDNLTLVTALGKIFFKMGLLLLHILLFGVFIGVIIAEFLRSEQLLSSFMTPAQLAIYKDKKLSFQREKTLHVPPPKRGLCIQITHYVTLTHAFDITVMTTIICDCLVITFHHLATSKDWKIIWGHYPSFIIFVYACELSMKFIGWRTHYWKSAWNIFDTFVVAVGIIDILFFKIQLGFVTADTIRFLRLLRIFQLHLFTKHAKLVHLCHSSLLKVLPCVANIIFLYGLLLYTFTTLGLTLGISSEVNSSSSRSMSSSVHELQEVLSDFNKIMVYLISLPFYGSVYSFQFAQTNPCWWSEYVWVFLLVYAYSFIVLSHILLGSVFAIALHEILKTLSISGAYSYLYTKHDEMTSPPHTDENDDVNENKYKHTNGGGFLNCDFAKSPDDPDSSATVLTPIEPLDDEDPLGEKEDERYPLRMSANGYILHVEATVTVV